MKKRKLYIVTTIFLVLGLLWIFRPERTKVDGLFGEFSGLLLTTDTQYAVDFTDKDFRRVKPGMTEKEVRDILGEPLTRSRPAHHTKFRDETNFVRLQYSESPSDTHYRLRQVHLNNGVVAEIRGYFYVD